MNANWMCPHLKISSIQADLAVQVAHRDLKSANILIARDFTAKVADVGEPGCWRCAAALRLLSCSTHAGSMLTAFCFLAMPGSRRCADGTHYMVCCQQVMVGSSLANALAAIPGQCSSRNTLDHRSERMCVCPLPMPTAWSKEPSLTDCAGLQAWHASCTRSTCPACEKWAPLPGECCLHLTSEGLGFIYAPPEQPLLKFPMLLGCIKPCSWQSVCLDSERGAALADLAPPPEAGSPPNQDMHLQLLQVCAVPLCSCKSGPCRGLSRWCKLAQSSQSSSPPASSGQGPAQAAPARCSQVEVL